jgi:Nuclease A inhibitor-like protein
MSNANATAALTKASTGLRYQSESDEAFTTFTWKKAEGDLTKEKLLERARKPASSPVQEVPLEDFFKDLTTQQGWQGEEEKAALEKYRNLLKVLRQSLSDVKVFKVGETKVSVFIVGKTAEGDWAGLKTTAVET